MNQGRAALTRLQIASVTAGNGLEFYDFVTYAFFATQIGRTLFPGDADRSLLLSLATFGVGFVSRPIGGIILGRYADSKGRKPALILSFTMMGLAMTGLALTPTYAAVGMLAPLMAVTFRLLQGFALGGEVGPNIAFLHEAAPEGRKYFYVSLNFATADGAVLIAGLVGFGLSSALSAPQLDAWGWRLAFLLGAAIVPFALRLRRTLVETLSDEMKSEPPARGARTLPVIVIAGLAILAAGTISNYTLEYMTTYAQATLHMAVPTAFAATIVLGGIGVVGDLGSGLLSDRFGPKKVLLVPWLALVVLIVPIFHWLDQLRTGAALLGATAVLTLLHIFGASPAVLLFVGAVPARIRAIGVGTLYAFGVAIFGGSTQVVETLLIRWTGNPIAPAWYMMAAVSAGLAAVMVLPDGVPRRGGQAPGVAAA